jgi:hypothetical protein
LILFLQGFDGTQVSLEDAVAEFGGQSVEGVMEGIAGMTLDTGQDTLVGLTGGVIVRFSRKDKREKHQRDEE